MSKMKREARLPKAVQSVTDPLVKVCGVEGIRSKLPNTFNLTKRSNMTTMEAKEAPPLGLNSKSALSRGQGKLLSSPMLLGSLELAQVIPAHGASNSLMDEGCHMLLGPLELAQLASAHGASNSLMDEGCHMLLGPLELAQLASAHGASNSLMNEGCHIQDNEKQEVTRKELLLDDMGSTPAPHAILQIGSQSMEAEHGSTLEAKGKKVIDDRGIAPMGITLETAGRTPPYRKDCGPTESDFEAQKSDDLSKAPPGSLIHTLYEQLLAAGDKEMTLKELLASIKNKQKAWQSFDSNWEHEVQSHVENNPHVQEIKRYRLKPNEQPDLQRQLEPSTTVMCMASPMISPHTTGDLELSVERNLQWDIQDLALPPRATTRVFPINHPKGLRSRRKACQKETIAVLNQLATDLEKIPIQESEVQEQMAEWIVGWVPDPSILEPRTCMQIPKWDAKRKCSSDGSEQADWLPVTISGCSQKQATQALAKQGEILNHHIRRDVRKDRMCPLNAMEVSKLCEHHCSQDAAKRARYAAHELQKKASLNSKGCPCLTASEMLSNEVIGMVTEQLVESHLVSSVGSVEKLVLELNPISSKGSVSNVKSEVDHNLDELAQRLHKVHFKGNVNLGGFDFKEIMELHVVTTANKRPLLVSKMTPASTVVVKTVSNGQPKADLPPTIPPQSPPHGVE